MPQESVSSSPSKSTSHVQTYLPSELLKQAALDAQNSYDIYDGSISTEGTGDELFLMTNHLLDGPQRGGQFRCAVTINHETKQITFITCGTRTDGGMRDALSDLQDDAYMALGWPPKKFAAAKELNQLVLDNLGDEAGDYSFHYTGHSLGAALSDLAATDMALKLQAQKLLTPGKISTITFDNPGSQYLVKKLLAPSGQELSDLKDAVSYISINNKPNFINTMDEQTGDTYYLVPQEQWHTDPLLKLIGFCGKYVPNPALSFLLDIISYGPPEHQIKDHSMVNFVEALVDKLEIAGVGGVDTIIKAGCFDDSYG